MILAALIAAGVLLLAVAVASPAPFIGAALGPLLLAGAYAWHLGAAERAARRRGRRRRGYLL